MDFVDGMEHMAMFEYSKGPDFHVFIHFAGEDLMKK